MSADWRDDLIKRCPRLFPEPVPWGLEVGDGWQKLMEELCLGLEEHIKTLPQHMLVDEAHGTPKRLVNQIKEKWGGLRFYMSISDETIDRLIENYEARSMETCEVCGKRGAPRDISWVKTLCDEHFGEPK